MIRRLFSTAPIFLLLSCSLLACSLIGCSGDTITQSVFEIEVRNIASETSFFDSAGAPIRVSFTSGVFVVHLNPAPFYTFGQSAPANGLEAFAEDADSSALIEAVRFLEGVTLIGIVNESSVAEDVLLLPGATYRFVVSTADQAARLSLALQFTVSNDLLVGTDTDGISLFDDAGNPINGDITGRFTLLDAGTEVNEPLVGPNSLPLQAMPNTGADEGGLVRPVDDGVAYPPVAEMLSISIRPLGQFE